MCSSTTPTETTAPTINYSRLTRRQAETVANTSRATLYRYRDEGKITVSKENGQTFYDAAELQRVFPDSFNLKRLETSPGDSVGQNETVVSSIETPAVSAVLEVEKRYLTEERDRLREDNERLRRELDNEREKREGERAEFMQLIRQNQETVKQLTHQPEKTEPEAAPARRGLFGFRRRT